MFTSGNKEETQHLSGCFLFWRMRIPPLGIFLTPIHKAIHKKATFEWGPEQYQAEMQNAVVQSMILSLYNTHSDIIL